MLNEEMKRRIAAALQNEPIEDERDQEESKKSRNPKRALELSSVMRDVSESCYAAGWMSGLEYALWSMILGGSRDYGMGEDDEPGVAQISVDTMRVLSEECDGWWFWHDDSTGAGPTPTDWGLRFVRLDVWKATYLNAQVR